MSNKAKKKIREPGVVAKNVIVIKLIIIKSNNILPNNSEIINLCNGKKNYVSRALHMEIFVPIAKKMGGNSFLFRRKRSFLRDI